LTKLPGYNNTPIGKGLQGATQTPYLNRRRAALQKQSGKFCYRAAGCDDIIHNRDMAALDRQFKPKGVFKVSFAQPRAELMLDCRGMCAFQRDRVITAA
jgi:hypothetical protein